MATLLPLLRYVEHTAPDAELLDRFDRFQDQEAFSELVRRHGPLVYQICRGLVGAGNADDAFQATFLILATRLRAARASAALGGWLTGVAGRVSRQMRRGAGRRARHEAAANTARLPVATGRTAERDDQVRVVDEEITLLPPVLRDPVVLCLVQDYTQDRAADTLGCNPRTLRRRLDRAKSVLRKRLERRGVVPAVAVALVAGASPLIATVPPELGIRTVALAVDLVAGGSITYAPALAQKFAVNVLAQKVFVCATASITLVALAAVLFVGSSANNSPISASSTRLDPPRPASASVVDDAEAQAVALVERLGGKVIRDETRTDKPVTKVDLSCTAVTSADLRKLTAFRHLTALDLSSTKVNNTGMSELVAFKSLTRLNLAHARLTSAGLKPVCALRTLTHLNLSGLSITRDRLKEIGALAGLVELDLSQTSITDAEVKELAAVKSLTALHLQYTKVTDAGVKELASLHALTELDLSHTKITDVGVKELAALTKLTKLRLHRTAVGDAACELLAALTGLTELGLLSTQLTDVGVKKLTALNKLTHFRASGPKMTETGVRELVELKSLTTLDLDVKVSDDGMRALATLPNLTALSLDASEVTAAGFRELRALKRLVSLTITCELLSDACMEELAGLTSLTHFHLNNMRAPSGTNRVVQLAKLLQTDQLTPTDTGISKLCTLKNLVELTLNDANLTDAGLRSIATLPKLTRLTLSAKNVTNSGLADLATITGLTDLSLHHAAITDAGLQELEVLTNLRTLNLFRTAITEGGLDDLRKVLPKCKISSGTGY